MECVYLPSTSPYLNGRQSRWHKNPHSLLIKETMTRPLSLNYNAIKVFILKLGNPNINYLNHESAGQTANYKGSLAAVRITKEMTDFDSCFRIHSLEGACRDLHRQVISLQRQLSLLSSHKLIYLHSSLHLSMALDAAKISKINDLLLSGTCTTHL